MNNDTKKGEKLTPIPLSTMIGQGNSFVAQGNEYTIRPLKLKDVPMFLQDGISIGSQIFNLSTPEAREISDKWIQKTLTKGDEPTSLNILENDDWDTSDLKRFWRELLELSG